MLTATQSIHTHLELPLYLSPQQKKLLEFPLDIAFREVWEDLNDRMLPKELRNYLSKFTAIVFKPEAIVSRKVDLSLELLRAEGFIPVAHKILSFNRNSIRQTWKYQFNRATRERIDFFDLLLLNNECLYVIFEDKNHSEQKSASEHLTDFKGCSTLKERRPHHLRHKLGWINVILNYVHTPDDPADFIRELGLFYESFERVTLLNKSLKSIDDIKAINETIDHLYRNYKEHDLSYEQALNRIVKLVESNVATGKMPIDTSNKIISKCNAFINRKDDDWRELQRELTKTELDFDLWDLITIASAVTTLSLPGLKSVF